MKTIMETPSPLKGFKLAQVAMGVRDIEAASRRWAAAFGVDVPPVIEVDSGDKVRMRYRGVASEARVRLAFFDLGGVQLELVEPVGENSAWEEGLARNGESVHHLAFWTENMVQSAEDLKAHGVTLIQRGDMGEGQYAYFDAYEPFGCMIELLERKRSGEV